MYLVCSAAGEDVIVLDGCRQCMYDGERAPNAGNIKEGADAHWKDEVPSKYHKIFPALGGMDTLVPKLWRWEFNLSTGMTADGPIDALQDRVLEFGMFNQQYAGRPYKYGRELQ